MAVVIFERTFQEPASGAQLLDMDRRNTWCFQAHRIQPKGHLVSSDGLRICRALEAPDAESVRAAGLKAGVSPPERVWSAELHVCEEPAGTLAVE